jgi:hypothetical protein
MNTVAQLRPSQFEKTIGLSVLLIRWPAKAQRVADLVPLGRRQNPRRRHWRAPRFALRIGRSVGNERSYPHGLVRFGD